MRAAFRTPVVACAITLLRWIARAPGVLALGLTITSLAGACGGAAGDEPKFLQAPASWNPKGPELTLGSANLEAFNALGAEEREAHLEALKGKPGSFKGQARFQRATELSDALDDAQLGKFEVYATVEEPVLFEITLDYFLYAPERLGHGFPPGTYVQFTGTLAGLEYQDQTKPRKLTVKVKDVALERLEN